MSCIRKPATDVDNTPPTIRPAASLHWARGRAVPAPPVRIERRRLVSAVPVAAASGVASRGPV